jgi:hypothetical protein
MQKNVLASLPENARGSGSTDTFASGPVPETVNHTRNMAEAAGAINVHLAEH